MELHEEKQILCPSTTCKEGSTLLGIVQKNGQVVFLKDRITIDQDFVEIAKSGRSPEARFRFSNKCIKNGCKQWTGERCGVIDKLMTSLKDCEFENHLPKCSIQDQCRWFAQSGKEACKICPLVITDLRNTQI